MHGINQNCNSFMEQEFRVASPVSCLCCHSVCLCVLSSVAIFAEKRCSVCLYLQLFSRYLCLLAHSFVQHILCCVFVCFVCLRLVYPTLPVSLDCQIWIALQCFLMFISSCIKNVMLHAPCS